MNLGTGLFVADRFRIPTPQPSTPSSLISAVSSIVEHHAWSGPIGVTIPAVVVDGIVRTAANIDERWIGFDAQTSMSETLGVPVAVLNDADAAGLAEVRYGGHDIENGVVLLLTFGTGIGSALINNGDLVPNTEFGRLAFRGTTAEEYVSTRSVKRDATDLEAWATRVNDYFGYIDRILSPRTIIVGGGISKRFHEFSALLDTEAEIEPARLRNDAGIVGAAMMIANKELQ